MGVLDGARRVCLFHAHPDDETLATGALIAGLVADGVEVAVVTATRGERGEVVAGPLKILEGTPGLVLLRERELDAALTALGVGTHAFLGTAPARAEGLPARVYRDSGMRWVTPTLAGPSLDAGPDSLTSASVPEAAADLAAFLSWWQPDVLISYDDLGGYGHPDHVACHHIAAAAVRSLRSERQRASRRVADTEPPESVEPVETRVPAVEPVEPQVSVVEPQVSVVEPRISVVEPVETSTPRFLQVVSEPRLGSVAGEEFDGSRWLDTVKAALRCHASQLTVDRGDVVHSGGQRQPIVTRVTII